MVDQPKMKTTGRKWDAVVAFDPSVPFACHDIKWGEGAESVLSGFFSGRDP